MDDLPSRLASSSIAASQPARLRRTQRATLISAAETFVKNAFANHDPSHDYHHVHRVRLLALTLTRSSELPALDMVVVELGALFHDLTDAKYTPSSSSSSTVLEPFWKSLPSKMVTDGQRQMVEKIVAEVSWSKDQRRRSLAASHRTVADEQLASWLQGCHEFQVVSDADRLDAIGSIGILRCAAYSSHVNRPLYVPPNNAQMDPKPPAEQAEGWNGSAVGHFHEKLLKIHGDRLYTVAGREEAERRQRSMRAFLDEMDLEWLVGWQGAQLALMDADEAGSDDDADEEEAEAEDVVRT